MTHEEFVETYRMTHATLHKLWSAAVGTEGYVKADWRLLDNTLCRYARYVAELIGYKGPLLLAEELKNLKTNAG